MESIDELNSWRRGRRREVGGNCTSRHLCVNNPGRGISRARDEGFKCCFAGREFVEWDKEPRAPIGCLAKTTCIPIAGDINDFDHFAVLVPLRVQINEA